MGKRWEAKIMKDIVEALRRTIKEAQDNGHRTIIFPVPDAEVLVEGIDKTYNIEDLRKAFDDGRLYDANELELNTKGEQTAFDAWIKLYKNEKTL
jgi:hypothetical protein